MSVLNVLVDLHCPFYEGAQQKISFNIAPKFKVKNELCYPKEKEKINAENSRVLAALLRDMEVWLSAAFQSIPYQSMKIKVEMRVKNNCFLFKGNLVEMIETFETSWKKTNIFPFMDVYSDSLKELFEKVKESYDSRQIQLIREGSKSPKSIFEVTVVYRESCDV